MKRDRTEYVCDSCLDTVVSTKGWEQPSGWVGITVETKGLPREEINFCQPCWEASKRPTKRELPILIRRFFGWTAKEPGAET